MIEKLSIGFIKKIYSMLTTGNDDVNFYCMCVQNRDREGATNRPLNFALTLLKINIMCRIPLLRKRLTSQTLGQDYLSEFFVRPTVCSFASGMIEKSTVITDIMSCVLTSIKSDEQVYLQIERETGICGFAKLRKKLSKQDIPIKEIYEIINEKLHAVADYKIELTLMEKYIVQNKYAARLLDIASCNNVKVVAMIKSCYPRTFIVKQLNKFNIYYNELLISSEHDDKKYKAITENCKYTGVFSADYSFIRKMMEYGCIPMYYRDPKTLMKRINHPDISDSFTDFYDGVCGLRLFSGVRRMSQAYELSYLCVAPSIYGFAQEIISKIAGADSLVCLCYENSLFAGILQTMLPANFNIRFLPWSENVANGFDKADSKALTEYVGDVIESGDNILIADPSGNAKAAKMLCTQIQQRMPDTVFRLMTLNRYLNCTNEMLIPLSRVLQGNKPILSGFDKDGRQWAYDKKISISTLKDIYTAVWDFSEDLRDYFYKSGNSINIDGADSGSLYLRADKKLMTIIN